MQLRTLTTFVLLLASAGLARAYELESSNDNVDWLWEKVPVTNSLDRPGDAQGDPDTEPYREFDYEVHNRRTTPIQMTLNVTKCENCVLSLKGSPFRIEPGETLNIGAITRADVSKPWDFYFESNWDDVAAGQPEEAPQRSPDSNSANPQ